MESSQTRDWTHVPEMAVRFLSTVSPGKSRNTILKGEINLCTDYLFYLPESGKQKQIIIVPKLPCL